VVGGQGVKQVHPVAHNQAVLRQYGRPYSVQLAVQAPADRLQALPRLFYHIALCKSRYGSLKYEAPQYHGAYSFQVAHPNAAQADTPGNAS